MFCFLQRLTPKTFDSPIPRWIDTRQPINWIQLWIEGTLAACTDSFRVLDCLYTGLPKIVDIYIYTYIVYSSFILKKTILKVFLRHGVHLTSESPFPCVSGVDPNWCGTIGPRKTLKTWWEGRLRNRQVTCMVQKSMNILLMATRNPVNSPVEGMVVYSQYLPGFSNIPSGFRIFFPSAVLMLNHGDLVMDGILMLHHTLSVWARHRNEALIWLMAKFK